MESEINPNYQEALDFLFSQLPMFSRVGAAAYKPGLDMTLALDRHFGSPHRKFKSIHIGGTNGKGSTAHSIAAILQSQGYKTALYTSPHLVDFRERIRINGEMIPTGEVVDFVERWRNSSFDGHPSFFELTMMLAFDWFARENVDYAVIEVGMGGRLDSTNIISPEICAITNISFDHTQFLGTTLPEIAAEKAGIIKRGIPVVIGEAGGDVERVFESKACEMSAPLYKAYEEQPVISAHHSASHGWSFTLKNGKKISFPLGGDCQLKNINTVLTLVKGMRDAGIEISDEAVAKGCEDVCRITGLRGRWEVISSSPLTICDTGHNEAGLSYNISRLLQLAEEKPGCKLRFLIGFVADKAVDDILGMFPHDAGYYITRAHIPRAMPVDVLAEKMAGHGFDAKSYPDVKSAWEAVKADSAYCDIIYVGGSTFIVADFLPLVTKE